MLNDFLCFLTGGKARMKKVLIIILVLLLVAAGITGGFWWYRETHIFVEEAV